MSPPSTEGIPMNFKLIVTTETTSRALRALRVFSLLGLLGVLANGGAYGCTSCGAVTQPSLAPALLLNFALNTLETRIVHRKGR